MLADVWRNWQNPIAVLLFQLSEEGWCATTSEDSSHNSSGKHYSASGEIAPLQIFFFRKWDKPSLYIRSVVHSQTTPDIERWYSIIAIVWLKS